MEKTKSEESNLEKKVKVKFYERWQSAEQKAAIGEVIELPEIFVIHLLANGVKCEIVK